MIPDDYHSWCKRYIHREKFGHQHLLCIKLRSFNSCFAEILLKRPVITHYNEIADSPKCLYFLLFGEIERKMASKWWNCMYTPHGIVAKAFFHAGRIRDFVVALLLNVERRARHFGPFFLSDPLSSSHYSNILGVIKGLPYLLLASTDTTSNQNSPPTQQQHHKHTPVPIVCDVI